MPCARRTHSAITGSRCRPWSVNRLPPNPPRVPCSFSHAAERTAVRDESFAASVAVMPCERARNHATRSLASATMRSSWACRTGGGGTLTAVAAPSRSKRANGVSGTSSSVLAGAHTPGVHTRPGSRRFRPHVAVAEVVDACQHGDHDNGRHRPGTHDPRRLRRRRLHGGRALQGRSCREGRARGRCVLLRDPALATPPTASASTPPSTRSRRSSPIPTSTWCTCARPTPRTPRSRGRPSRPAST